VFCILAGLILLSASRNGPVGGAKADSMSAPQHGEEPLLDIAQPFDTTVHCIVNGEDHVVVVQRRIRLFFLPHSPQSAPDRKVREVEGCE